MDMQQKIAARRAQLAEQRQVATEAAELAKVEQEKAALCDLASDLSTESTKIIVKDDELKIAQQALPPIDIDGLREGQLRSLLNREARKRWTPGENWWVIGCIVGGICTIHLGGFGILPLGLGLLSQSQYNKRYRKSVVRDYPDVFARRN